MTPPAPTLAPGRVSVDAAALEALCELADMGALYRAYDHVVALHASACPLPPAPVAAMTEAEARALVDAYARASGMAFIGHVSDPNNDGPSEALDATYRALIAALTATLAAPVAGTFEDMVDAFEHATCEMNELVASTRDDRRERIHRAHEQARAALLAAHAAEVQAARAGGGPVTPYFERDGVTIYCGDCREVLPGLGRVALVLTDPPYGLGDRWQGGT